MIAEKLRGVVRRAKASIAPRAVILLYHRICDTPPGADPYNLCVSPPRFAEQMEILARRVPVFSLPALVKHIQSGTLPHRCAAVTFDDGYADNLHVAKPILARHNVPATVFATTGTSGRTEEFYWDECEQLIRGPHPAGQSLQIRLGTVDTAFDVAAVEYSTAAIDAVCELLLNVPPDERGEVMRQVREWAGVARPHVRRTHRAMTDAEISELASDDLVEIGAHTENHPALPTLIPHEQMREISGSKARLESILGRRVESFAYPYGRYSAASVQAVRAAGFSRACSTLEHAARLASDEMCLPRFDMGDCDGEAFERKLRWAFGR